MARTSKVLGHGKCSGQFEPAFGDTDYLRLGA